MAQGDGPGEMPGDDRPEGRLKNLFPKHEYVPWLVEGARLGSRRSAQRLLSIVIEDLRAGVPLEPTASSWLAETLVAIVSSPGQTAKVLGIDRTEGGQSRNRELRLYAGRIALRLHENGALLKNSRDGTDAIARTIEILAAEDLDVTDKQVEDGYREAKRERARHQANKATAKAALTAWFDEKDAEQKSTP